MNKKIVWWPIFVLFTTLNLFLSGFIYFRFKMYEKSFNVHKIIAESYQINHRYEIGKVYKIVNDTHVLPNGKKSYIVQGLTFVDGVFVADQVIREIDVPQNRISYVTAKDKKVNGVNPEFLTVVKTGDEESAIFFNSADSLFFYTKQENKK